MISHERARELLGPEFTDKEIDEIATAAWLLAAVVWEHTQRRSANKEKVAPREQGDNMQIR